MSGRLVTAVLIAAGLLLVVHGVRTWFDHRAATSVVQAFLDAVIQGDREAALAQLVPEQRARLDEGSEERLAPLSRPQPGAAWRIHHVEIAGDRAVAKLWIERDGFVIQPLLHLRRSEANRWQIGPIEDLHVDPRWHDLERHRQRLADEQLAHELSEALKHRPGVSVERAASPK